MSREEDDTTATEQVVDGIREPATDETRSSLLARVSQQLNRRAKRENLRRTNVGTSINETNENLTTSRTIRESIVRREPQIGTVGTSLIPTLDGSTDGASSDGQEKTRRHAPLVIDLIP